MRPCPFLFGGRGTGQEHLFFLLRRQFHFQESCSQLRFCSGRSRRMDTRSSTAIVTLFLVVTSVTGRLPASSTIQDKLHSSPDFITQDLFEKYSEIDPKDFWHPHSFTSSGTSREIVQVEKVEKRIIPGKYLQFKHARIGFNHYVFGLTSYSIDVLGSDLKKITSIQSNELLITLTVFSRWNFEGGYPEILIPVGTIKGIEIYKLVNDVISKVSDGWPLHYDIKALEFCNVGHTTKLVVVPSQRDIPVDIYNVAINETSQVWYHQRLPVTGDIYVAVYELGSESLIAIVSELTITIYVYEEGEGRFTSQQIIPLLSPSKHVVSFSIAYKHYLASIPKGPGNVQFFGFNGHQYTAEEGIAQVQTDELHALNVEDYRDEHFILSKGTDGRIQILTYDGLKFNDDFKCPKEICYSKAELEKGIGFTVNEISYFLLPTTDSTNQAEVLVITKSIEDSASALFKQSADVISELKALFKRFKRWEGIVNSLKETLADSLSLTNTNIITGNWFVESVQSPSILLKGDGYKDMNPFNRFQFLDTAWEDVDFSLKVTHVDQTLLQLKEVAEESKEVLKDAIPIESDKMHVVVGSQRVLGSFSTPSLQVDNLEAGVINYEENIREFLTSFVLYQKSIRIQSSIRFAGELRIGNLYTEKLNGILVRDIARLHKPNHFECHLEFKDLAVGANLVTERVNGVKFSQEIIRVSDIAGVKLIDGVVGLKRATLTEAVDGLHVTKETFQELLLSATVQKTLIPYSFTDIRTNGSVQVSTINGYDFVSFVRLVVTEEFSGLIRGQKKVTGSFATDSLFIEGTLNGYKFPHDLVTKSQKRLQISGIKNFTELTAEKVVLDGLVDGISTGDLVSRLDYDTVKGKWTLGAGVVFLNDVAVKGYVDGVKMEALKHTDTLDKYKSSYYPDADVEFLQPVTFRNLKVRDRINGKSFQEVFEGLLAFDSREIKIKGKTTFEKSISALDLQLLSGKLNGIPLDEFFSISTHQNISGHKSFEGDIRFSSLYALDTFDSVYLPVLLENSFRLSKARTVTSELSFDEVNCSKLKVEGGVNDFVNFGSLAAVVSGRKEQVFQTSVEIEGLSVESLEIVGNLAVRIGKEIQGLDFNSWKQRRISLSKEFQTSYPVEILGHVRTRGSCETRKINDILLSYLDHDILRTDRPEQILTKPFQTSAPITVEYGAVTFEKDLSGLDLDQIREEGIPLSPGNEVTITGNWSFESLVITSELTVEGTTCGVDLAKLDADSLRSGESDVYISGETTFLNEVEVKEDLFVGKVNSEELFTYVFTLNTSQDVKGHIHFGGNIFVDGDLVSSSSINSVSLPWLASIYAFENGSTHVLRSEITGDASLESTSLHVQKLVQGYDLKKFLLSIVNLQDKSMRITGHKTFTEPITVQGDFDVRTVNSVDVDELKGILLIDNDVRFSVPVTFTQLLEAPSLHLAYGDINTRGLVGDVNLTELVNGAAYLNSQKSIGTLTFNTVNIQGNIEEVEFLNDIALQDVIRLDNPQHILQLNVKEAIFKGRNIDVGGLISGFNFLQEFQNTLFKKSTTRQIVKGVTSFEGNVQVKGNLECYRELSDSVVTLDKGGLVEFTVEFVKEVTVMESLEVLGKINGESLDELVRDFLTDGRTETINGHWTFAGGVTFKGVVTGNGLLDGYHLGELVDQKKAEALKAEKNFSSERYYFEERCELLDALYNRVSQSPIKLEFFETHQPPIQLKQSIQRLVTIQAGNMTRVLTFAETCEVGSFEWDNGTELFMPTYSPPRLGDASEWISTNQKGLGILVFRSEKSSCSATEGVYVVTMDSNGKFSSKDTLLTGEFSRMTITQDVVDGWTALFVLEKDETSLQIFHWNDNKRCFELLLATELGVRVLRMKATLFKGGLGLFFQSDLAVHFHLFNIAGTPEETWQLGFVGRSLAESSDSLIQVVTTGKKTFGFLETRESAISSDCTLQVFDLTETGVRLFQQIKAPSVLSIRGISFGQEVYVGLLTKDAGLQIQRYMGLNGFEALDGSPLRLPHAQGLTMMNLHLWNHRLTQPFIAVSTGSTLQILHSVLNGDSVEYNHKKTQDLCRLD